jgi:hypothetical protein
VYDDDDDDSRLACTFNPSIIDKTCPSDCESATVDRASDDDDDDGVVVLLLLSLYVVVVAAAAAAGTIVVEAADATASLVEGRDDDPASAYAGLLGEDSVMMDETDADSIPWRSARRSPFVVVVGGGGCVVVVAIFIVAAVVIVEGEYCLYDEAEIVVGVAIRLLLSPEVEAPPPATRD